MRRSKSQWYQLIDQQLASGLSAVQFCREHGIDAKSLSQYKRKRRSKVKSASAFIKVKAPDRSIHQVTIKYSSLEIQLSSASPSW